MPYLTIATTEGLEQLFGDNVIQDRANRAMRTALRTQRVVMRRLRDTADRLDDVERAFADWLADPETLYLFACGRDAYSVATMEDRLRQLAAMVSLRDENAFDIDLALARAALELTPPGVRFVALLVDCAPAGATVRDRPRVGGQQYDIDGGRQLSALVDEYVARPASEIALAYHAVLVAEAHGLIAEASLIQGLSDREYESSDSGSVTLPNRVWVATPLGREFMRRLRVASEFDDDEEEEARSD